ANDCFMRDCIFAGSAVDGVVAGSRCRVEHCQITSNVGTSVRVPSGSTGVVLHDLAISGSGVAMNDAGVGTHLRDTTVNASGGNGGSLMVVGERAVLEKLAVNASNSNFTGAMIDETGLPVWDWFAVEASSVTAPSLIAVGEKWSITDLTVKAKDCNLS